jgi:hypothetical protein
MSTTLITYVWLDLNNQYCSDSIIGRNLEITNIKEVKPRSIEFIVDKDGKKGTQSAILHPVKLYKNCFKVTKSSFFILCNAQYSNEDFDRKVYEKELVMGAKQQFYLLNSDGKPINDKNVDVKEYKQPFYSVIYKCTPKIHSLLNYANTLEKLLIISDIRILEMNTTILSQIMVSICENGMSLADDIIMLRYIAKELANTMGLKAVFDNNFDDEKQNTKCIFDFYTPGMMKEGGYEELKKLTKNLEENHEDYNKNCLVDGQSATEFKLSIGHFNGSIRVPVQTYSTKMGSINDLRALSNCNPYRVINNIYKSMGKEFKEFYTMEEGVDKVSRILSDEEELNMYMKPYIDDISYKIKTGVKKLFSNTDTDKHDMLKTKINDIRTKYDKNIIDLLREKKTGEMYDVVKKLLKEIEDSMPTIEINLNDK